jgi:hypothetical protein
MAANPVIASVAYIWRRQYFTAGSGFKIRTAFDAFNVYTSMTYSTAALAFRAQIPAMFTLFEVFARII